IESRRCNAGVESDIAPQVEAVGNVVGIGEDFRLGRVFLRPVPFLIQLLRKGKRVLHAFDVATRAGIAIPVPGATDAAPGLKNARREAEPAQSMQHIHAGESGADNHGVVTGSYFGGACPSIGSLGVHDFVSCVRFLWPTIMTPFAEKSTVN